MRWVATLDIDKDRAPTNRASRGHWTKRADVIREIREDIKLLCWERGNKAPHFTTPVTIDVRLECRRGGGARRLDTDAGYAVAKAAVDGLRDARVIVNDTPEWVHWIRHWGPVWSDDGRDAIRIEVASAT